MLILPRDARSMVMRRNRYLQVPVWAASLWRQDWESTLKQCYGMPLTLTSLGPLRRLTLSRLRRLLY